MRIETNFTNKIKLVYNFVFKNKNIRIMTCGSCGNTNIVPISNSMEEPYVTNNINADILFIQFSKCNNCGAVCKELQLWNKNGNVKELDKNVIIKN